MASDIERMNKMIDDFQAKANADIDALQARHNAEIDALGVEMQREVNRFMRKFMIGLAVAWTVAVAGGIALTSYLN